MNRIFSYIAVALSSLPLGAFAATVRTPSNFKDFIGILTSIINTLIVLVFVLTFLVFAWGLIKGWIIHGGDAEGVESGKKIVFAGIIALVVMSTIWGILTLLQTSLFGG